MLNVCERESTVLCFMFLLTFFHVYVDILLIFSFSLFSFCSQQNTISQFLFSLLPPFQKFDENFKINLLIIVLNFVLYSFMFLYYINFSNYEPFHYFIAQNRSQSIKKIILTKTTRVPLIFLFHFTL